MKSIKLAGSLLVSLALTLNAVTATAASATYKLNISVYGLNKNNVATLKVTGPNGYSKTLSTSKKIDKRIELKNLSSGKYSITPLPSKIKNKVAKANKAKYSIVVSKDRVLNVAYGKTTMRLRTKNVEAYQIGIASQGKSRILSNTGQNVTSYANREISMNLDATLRDGTITEAFSTFLPNLAFDYQNQDDLIAASHNFISEAIYIGENKLALQFRYGWAPKLYEDGNFCLIALYDLESGFASCISDETEDPVAMGSLDATFSGFLYFSACARKRVEAPSIPIPDKNDCSIFQYDLAKSTKIRMMDIGHVNNAFYGTNWRVSASGGIYFLKKGVNNPAIYFIDSSGDSQKIIDAPEVFSLSRTLGKFFMNEFSDGNFYFGFYTFANQLPNPEVWSQDEIESFGITNPDTGDVFPAEMPSIRVFNPVTKTLQSEPYLGFTEDSLNSWFDYCEVGDFLNCPIPMTKWEYGSKFNYYQKDNREFLQDSLGYNFQGELTLTSNNFLMRLFPVLELLPSGNPSSNLNQALGVNSDFYYEIENSVYHYNAISGTYEKISDLEFSEARTSLQFDPYQLVAYWREISNDRSKIVSYKLDLVSGVTTKTTLVVGDADVYYTQIALVKPAFGRSPNFMPIN